MSIESIEHTAQPPDAHAALIAANRFPEPVYVTRPSMPALADYTRLLEEIWERRWLTNDGELHQRLERALRAYCEVDNLSLFCNGTIALLVALQALRIDSGDVITTPFTFAATSHVLHWNHVRPVFCDIEPETYTLDPRRVEAAITSETKAILAVHVYGNPCDVDALQQIADRHGLALLYDAAHAFGVRCGGRSVLAYGDMSMLSFHATKLFSTGEGGALVTKTAAQHQRVNSLKNFGIAGEESVIGPGINGKMNEFQAAFGLLHLEQVDGEIEARRRVTDAYREALAGIPGLRFMESDMPGVRHNYAYFPIEIDPAVYGMSRDDAQALLRRCNVFPRKYFYPLCSQFPCYSSLHSSAPANLPVAERVTKRILCLPIYGALDVADAARIARLLREFGTRA